MEMELEGYKKANALLMKGMESQCELMDQLKQQCRKLEKAIRTHRDFKGDDRCWMDDEELYSVLPEGYTRPIRDTTVELENCKKFIASRSIPFTEYISPERRIKELEKQLADLKGIS